MSELCPSQRLSAGLESKSIIGLFLISVVQASPNEQTFSRLPFAITQCLRKWGRGMRKANKMWPLESKVVMSSPPLITSPNVLLDKEELLHPNDHRSFLFTTERPRNALQPVQLQADV